MITRRTLCRSLGLSGMLTALPAVSRSDAVATGVCGRGRARIDLSGIWNRYAGGVFYDKIEVPSSQRPFGCYELRRQVLVPALCGGERAILRLEAITYHARVSFNQVDVGVMGPYTPYEFDVTPSLKQGTNEISVMIFDLQPERDGSGKDEIELGVNLGWEAYSGIIRDVYLEIRPGTHIGNVQLGYQLSKSLDVADCTAKVFMSAATAGRANIRLSILDGITEVASAERQVVVSSGQSTVDLKFQLKPPSLWSPSHPNLYTITVRLESGASAAGYTDQYSFMTGFRKIEARGPNFYLNGTKFKLHGLSWLGTWKDQGFTLSRAQMESDMRNMKEMGCNFVRLHLFPQDRYMLELADKLGLFVCEEPGFWQVDFASMRHSLMELGLDVLARTIRRDWNSPSVFAWLLSNESENTVDYLRRGREMCERLDPIQRFVSAANYRSAEEVKPIFDLSRMDFYSDHPYTFDPHRFDKACEQYGGDKPLVFDEWGGRAIGQSDFILPQQCDQILNLMDKDKLAGEVFFSWNDFPQFARVDAETIDGIVESGVVSEARERRNQEYSQLTQLFRSQHQAPSFQPSLESPQLVPLRHSPWPSNAKFDPIDLQLIAQMPSIDRAWSSLERDLTQYWDTDWMNKGEWDRMGGLFQFWKDTPIEILGVPFHCPIKNGYVRPLAATAKLPEIEIPIRNNCRRLHILGQVTLPSGYPLQGEPGVQIAEYRVKDGAGTVKPFPLRNGMEVCTANLIYHATRIAPEPTIAQRAILFMRDPAREHYQVLLHTIELGGHFTESISVSLLDRQFPLLLFAITVEAS